MPTPVPMRIQTPDLAFVDALQLQLTSYQAGNEADGLLLSIVPAEPASSSLLNDLRLNGRRFTGAFVPHWLIPDLVRDDYLLPAPAPSAPLPASIARLRSFGGQWVASDLDHDCALLFYRADQLDAAGIAIPQTWDELLEAAASLNETGSGIAVPCNFSQQITGYFCAMAANYVDAGVFWFDADSMDPVIASPQHAQALDVWGALAQLVPTRLRDGSTGDLWEALIAGSIGFLVASASFLPFALDRMSDPSSIGVAPLPGIQSTNGTVSRTGNTTGANWGSVVIRGTNGTDTVGSFLEYLSTPKHLAELWSDRSTAILPAPVGSEDVTRDIEQLTSMGWPDVPSRAWLTALQETFGNPNQLIPLRIAETQRYLQALENELVRFLSSQVSTAAEALERAASQWRAINEVIDVEIQRELFRPVPKTAAIS